MHGLPVVSCDGCGACCEKIGSPPFAYLRKDMYPHGVPSYWGECEPPEPGVIHPDADRWEKIPAEAAGVILEYYRRDRLDRYDRGLPCLWYDGEKNSCRWYDWRPEICRNFEVGCESCLGYRARKNLPGANP